MIVLAKAHLKCKNTAKVKVKSLEKNYHGYNDQKKTGIVSLIPKKVDKLGYILGHEPRLYNFKEWNLFRVYSPITGN